MKWFDQWLAEKVKQAWNSPREEKVQYDSDLKYHTMNAVSANPVRKMDREPTLNFRLHHAENGWIVEVTCHDTRTDRHTTRMHLIGDDQEFDHAICQIITLEALRG
jgi:hypothetical protein